MHTPKAFLSDGRKEKALWYLPFSFKKAKEQPLYKQKEISPVIRLLMLFGHACSQTWNRLHLSMLFEISPHSKAPFWGNETHTCASVLQLCAMCCLFSSLGSDVQKKPDRLNSYEQIETCVVFLLPQIINRIAYCVY